LFSSFSVNLSFRVMQTYKLIDAFGMLSTFLP